jgi:DNA repair photolyase
VALTVRKKRVKSALSRSGIPGADYCVNPYVGCSHACRYCYATFMKRFTGHGDEAWGSFVDVKENAPEVLERELGRLKKGKVMLSSVTDAYQPLEATERITRRCLALLVDAGFPVDILTKSPLVTRDLDIIRKSPDVSVGLTVTTDDEGMRRLFEPRAASISARVGALRKLKEKGVDTYVFIGPVLPMNPEKLVRMLKPHVNAVLIDRMNYQGKTKAVFREKGLLRWLDDAFVDEVIERLVAGFGAEKVTLC